MIKIYKELIKKYIHHITEEDIKKYALKHNEKLTDQEVKIINSYLKKNYNSLLNKDTSSFESLKAILRKDLVNKMIILYNEYNKYI